MPCDPISDADGKLIAIVCTRGNRRRCSVPGCKGPGAFLCDGPGAGRASTCDAPICGHHKISVGKNRDLCPKCYRSTQPDLRFPNRSG